MKPEFVSVCAAPACRCHHFRGLVSGLSSITQQFPACAWSERKTRCTDIFGGVDTISVADGNNFCDTTSRSSQVSLSHNAPPNPCITRSLTLLHAKHETARPYFVSLWKAVTLCAYALINHTIGHMVRSPTNSISSTGFLS